MLSRRGLGLLVVVCLSAAYLGAGWLPIDTASPPESAIETVDEAELIQPADGGSYLWPYTSRSASVQDRTLAINIIIHAPPEQARTALTASSELEWEETPANQTDADPETYRLSPDRGVDWDDADGSTRYSYIDSTPQGGSGQWVDESYQLHTGSYLGSRYHIRGYSAEADNWTAIQVHEEYFDWFRLRHTVTDIDDASRLVEDDFIGQPFVESVSRTHYGITGGWSDGWVSEIELATVLILLAGMALNSRQTVRSGGLKARQWAIENRYGLLLAASLCGLILGIRGLGIALELAIPGQSPQLLAGLLYPLLVAGPPILVAVIAPHLGIIRAFGFTVGGMAVGFVYDFSVIGLSAIPLQLLLHRVGIVLALGLFAVAIVDSHNSDPRSTDGIDPPLVLVAAAAWLLGLALPMFGYV